MQNLVYELLIKSSGVQEIGDTTVVAYRCNGKCFYGHGIKMLVIPHNTNLPVATKYIPNSRLQNAQKRLEFDHKQMVRAIHTGTVPNKQVKLHYNKGG